MEVKQDIYEGEEKRWETKDEAGEVWENRKRERQYSEGEIQIQGHYRNKFTSLRLLAPWEASKFVSNTVFWVSAGLRHCESWCWAYENKCLLPKASSFNYRSLSQFGSASLWMQLSRSLVRTGKELRERTWGERDGGTLRQREGEEKDNGSIHLNRWCSSCSRLLWQSLRGQVPLGLQAGTQESGTGVVEFCGTDTVQLLFFF